MDNVLHLGCLRLLDCDLKQMKIDDALALINHEHEADDGLLIKFRIGDDVNTERLERFLEALVALSLRPAIACRKRLGLRERRHATHNGLKQSVLGWRGFTANLERAEQHHSEKMARRLCGRIRLHCFRDVIYWWYLETNRATHPDG